MQLCTHPAWARGTQHLVGARFFSCGGQWAAKFHLSGAHAWAPGALQPQEMTTRGQRGHHHSLPACAWVLWPPPALAPPPPTPQAPTLQHTFSQGVLESSLPTSPLDLGLPASDTQRTGEPEESSGRCVTCRTRGCFQVMGEPDWGSELMLLPNKAHFPTITSRSPLGAGPRDTCRLQAEACLSHPPGRQWTPALPQVPSVPPQPSGPNSPNKKKSPAPGRGI